MEKPSKYIKEITRTLFSAAYLQAANAFGTLTGKKVSVTRQEIMLNEQEELIKKISNSREITILQTEVIGDARGRSFLIMNNYEAEKLLEFMLAKLKNKDSNAHFNDIILQELDNVLAASVITQLSDFLDLKIYGDVPSLIRPAESAQSWLKNQFQRSRGTISILSSVCFTFEDDIRLQPYFVWILDEDFYSTLNQKAEAHANSQLS